MSNRIKMQSVWVFKKITSLESISQNICIFRYRSINIIPHKKRSKSSDIRNVDGDEYVVKATANGRVANYMVIKNIPNGFDLMCMTIFGGSKREEDGKGKVGILLHYEK